VVGAIDRVSRGENFRRHPLEYTVRHHRSEESDSEGVCLMEDGLVTVREKQILRSCAAGLSFKQIASQHSSRFHTVVSHLRNRGSVFGNSKYWV
jgi:DNA-binding NarL/FixJ family response regulator